MPRATKIKSASAMTLNDIPLEVAFTQSDVGGEYSNNRVYARHISSGTLRGEQQIGDENIKIDSSNRRILIYDETGNARVLVGYDQDGF